MENKNNNLLILEAEKERAEIRLKEQITTIRDIIDRLELKLKCNQHLYISDGLQGNGGNVDIYLSQLVAYNRTIELFNRQINED